MNEEICIENYTDTVFYQIELTAKYARLKGQQLFEKCGSKLTTDEFMALNIVIENKKMCQRDIAKIILKDRANTGKLLDNLEKKGLIKRELSVRNNRLVKFVIATEEGEKLSQEIMLKISPFAQNMKNKIYEKDLIKIKELLAQLRELMDEGLETHI